MKKRYFEPELELLRLDFGDLMVDTVDPSDPQSGVSGGDNGESGDPFG